MYKGGYWMKRYGLSIAFVLLIIISIGTYYTQATTSHYPNFKLVKQFGDESEIEGVSLAGGYINNLNYRTNPSVIVDSSGSTYTNRSTVLLIDPFYWYSSEVKQLVSDHRQFMRGKRNVNAIYEDEYMLVYADVKSDDAFSSGSRSFYFDVSVLDKIQKKSWSYEVSVPNRDSEYMINVQDVQVFEDEIVVVTSNYTNRVGTEYHLYRLGLANKQIPLDQVILLPQPKNTVIESSGIMVNFDVQSVYDTYTTKPNNYSVFYARQTQTAYQDADTYIASELGANSNQLGELSSLQSAPEKTTSAQIIIYDLRTGLEVKSNTQHLVDSIKAQSDTSYMNLNLNGNHLFLTQQSEQGIKVMEYNIKEEETINHDIHLDNPKVNLTLKVINNQRMYVVTEDVTKKSVPNVIIVDLKTDKTIYRGTIELTETEQSQGNEWRKLNFYTMEIK
jgi:hypothetical protein